MVVEPLSRMEVSSPIPVTGAKPLCDNRSVVYFLGIDGGGSKTTCVLGDEQRVCGSVTVGGSNIVRRGMDQARTALQQGVRDVCREAAIKPAQIVAICAGIAGAAREDVRKPVTGILAKLAPAQIEVVGDMVIAHQAALSGAPGIVVLAGTGSIAYGRHPSVGTSRAGGWGHAISDQGSGHWIGVQAVAAVSHALDSGSYTKLSDRILKHWGVRSYDALIYCANTSPLPDFAGLFSVVLAAAQAGDFYAHDILARAGVELARLAEVVFHRLWKVGEEVEVALAGGVFQNSIEVRASLRRELQSSIPQAQISLSTTNAAEGALALARKMVAAGQVNP
jgi:glucosamine kinase